MLLALQFPITDVRPFLLGETYRLGSPTWPSPAINQQGAEFVRFCGVIRERRGGGSQDWTGEERYCQARNAVQFHPSYDEVGDVESARPGVRRFCAFRNFMADGRFIGDLEGGGSVVARLEVGIGFRSAAARGLQPSPTECLQYVRSTAMVQVTLRCGAAKTECALGDSAPTLATLFLQASTKLSHAQLPPVEPWWCSAGLPLALVEFGLGSQPPVFPPNSQRIEHLSRPGIELAYTKVPFGKADLGTWLIGLGSQFVDRDYLRRVRLNLLRLHAERESIHTVLNLLVRRKIKIDLDSTPTKRLLQYVDQSIGLLNRKRHDGLRQSDLLAASAESVDFARPGERQTLLDMLNKIRPNLLRKVGAYVQKQPGATPLSAARNKVFVSYSHKDRKLFEELMTILDPAQNRGLVDIWADTRIETGAIWRAEIEEALSSAKVGVLLVSDNFLASKFIRENELPPLLQAAKEAGVTIFWVLLSPCLYDETEFEPLQCANDVEKPLDALSKPKRKAAWKKIAQKLLNVAERP